MNKVLFIGIFSLGWLSIVLAQRKVPNFSPPTLRRVNQNCIPRDCKPPSCFCTGTSSPLYGVKSVDLPQMVMLTFDDAIQGEVAEYYKKLFTEDRKNPNGCPISATFYLSHNWTDYDVVRDLYTAGHEVASHTITHRMPQHWWTYASYEDWEREMEGERVNIEYLANIPRSEIHGARVPYLETGGDAQYQMMVDKKFEYDSSFMTGPHDEGGVWPFTLDYPPSVEYCSNNNCPKSSFKGFWEIPLNRMIGPDGKACAMTDFCQTQPLSKDQTLSYLWKNFHRFYGGNRAPMGVHLHATWFMKDEMYFEAVDEFIGTLSKMNDVYLVTSHQVIEWMRNPVKKDKAESFEPWKASCRGKEAMEATLVKVTTTPPTTRASTTTTTTTTTLPPTTTTTTTKAPTTRKLTPRRVMPSTTLHPLIKNGFFGGPPPHWKPPVISRGGFSRRPGLGGPQWGRPAVPPGWPGFIRRGGLARIGPGMGMRTSLIKSRMGTKPVVPKEPITIKEAKSEHTSASPSTRDEINSENAVLKMADKTEVMSRENFEKKNMLPKNKFAPKGFGSNTIGRFAFQDGAQSEKNGKSSAGQLTSGILATVIATLFTLTLH